MKNLVVTVIGCVLTLGAIASGTVDLNKTNEWGSKVTHDIWENGSRMAVLAGDELLLYEIQSGGSVVQTGGLVFNTAIYHVSLDGNFAAVSDDSHVYMIDISNPASCDIVSTFPGGYGFTDGITDLVLADGMLYVAIGETRDGEFYVYNVQNPAVPAVSDSLSFGSDCMVRGMAKNGNTVYLTGLGPYPDTPWYQYTQMWAVDVTDPAALSVLGTFHYESTGCYTRPAITGNTAVLGLIYGGLVLTVDISNPADMTELGFARLLSSGNYELTMGVVVQGDTALVALRGEGIQQVDISDPSNPVALIHVSSDGHTMALSWSDTYAYAANFNEGIFQVENPSTASIDVSPLIPDQGTTGETTALSIDGSVLLVAQNQGGVAVLDISNPDTPVELSRIEEDDAVTSVVLDGPIAAISLKPYYSQYLIGIRLYDLSNPSHPVLLSSEPWGTEAIDMSMGNGFLLSTDYDDTKVYDVRNPSEPVLLATLNSSGTASNAIYGSYGVIATISGVSVLDLSTPGEVEVLCSNSDVPYWKRGVAFNGSEIFIVNSGNVSVMQWTYPDQLELLCTIPGIDGVPSDLALRGTLLYVTTWSNGILVYDVSEPSTPVYVGRSDSNSGFTSIAFGQDRFYSTLFTVGTVSIFQQSSTLTYSLTTAVEAGNGTISPAGSANYTPGTEVEVTAVPDDGWTFSHWTGDLTGSENPTSITMNGDATIYATFVEGAHIITAVCSPNGSILPSGDVSVDHGDDQSFTITPADGYHVNDVLVDGVSVGAITSYAFINVTADHAINADFAIDTYTIMASADGNGSITPSGAVSVDHGTSQAFTIIPDTDCHIVDVLVDGVSVGAVDSYTFTNITSDHTIAASFAVDTVTYTITATAGANGSISPSGTIEANEGTTRVFTITPDTGYQAADVIVDSLSVGAVSTYTFSGINADHTIHASFDQVVDNDPPTTPSGLYVHSASAGDLELRFNPSTDSGGSGFYRYHIYRSEAKSKTKAEIGTSTTASYSDTGVSEGQTTYYSVIAEDNAGNLSDPSETIGIIIPPADTESPGEPVGLTATLVGGEVLSVDLAWKLAGDDGSGVSVYEVFRQNDAPGVLDTPYAVARSTRYSDTHDVTIGETCTYWVRTRDLAGNVSSAVSVSLTVPLAGMEPVNHIAYFPHLATGAKWWTGFALTNTGGAPANISIEFFDSEGLLLTTLTDPVTLAGGEKILTTIAALFDDNVPEGASWWRVLSDQPLNGFELFGRPSNDDITEEMVGVKIARGASTRLLFPIVTVDEDTWTGIAMVNTSAGAMASATFSAYAADGTLLATSDPVDVPSFAKTVRLAESYFNDELPAGTAILIMEADQPCIGFELYGYKDHTGLAGVSAVTLRADAAAEKRQSTAKSAVDHPFRYRISRTIESETQQASYKLINTTTELVHVRQVTYFAAGGKMAMEQALLGMGSLEINMVPDAARGMPVAIEIQATGPLTVCETFEDGTVGYFDSLFAMSDGASTNPITHIATSTGYWDTDLYLWNPTPYFNEVTLKVFGPDGAALDLSTVDLTNPFIVTLDPFASLEGEIHDLITDDDTVKQIGWIQVQSQFSLNGYFTFGTKDGRKISAIELE